MKKHLLTKIMLLLCALIVGSGSVRAVTSYTLVKNITELAQGDIILVTSGTDGNVKAMGTYASGNNISAVDISISSETISSLGSAQEITLESKNASGNFTFRQTANSYLYAANSKTGSNNYLKAKDDNTIYWSVTVDTKTYVATVNDVTSDCNSRNALRYNSSNKIFSCYTSGTQAAVYIFKKQPSTDPSINAANVNVAFNGTSGEISYEVTNAVDGATIEATSVSDWISSISVNESTKKVSFSTSVNEGVANRVGAITLNYKKAGETLATKAVTITQAYLVLADPVFSHVPGFYTPLSVTITCATGGSQIYYTTDGSDPKTNGTLYSSAIAISETTTVKAVSKKSGYYRNVVEATYTIDPHICDFSWDLSTDNTATATEDEMTWTGSYASMAAAKASASTKTNNYYPGTSGQSYTSTRFYKNSTLTITPATGSIIKSIVCSATSTNYASALASSTWSNATAELFGNTVVVTPTVGTSAISATLYDTSGLTNVTVKYIENVPLTITCTGGIASFSYSKALDFTGSEATAYIIKSTSENYATLTQVTKVPANTGIIVTGTKDETYNIPVTNAETDDVTGNLLKATSTGAKAVEKDEAYGLSKTDGLFHLLNAGTIPVNKAYLVADEVFPTSTPAPSLMFNFGETTGISRIDNGELRMENGVYNLAGQRVAKPTKGLYIVNGRKVVIK